MWKNEEVNKSSTWREMKAIFIILQSLSLCLSNKLVKIYTDNQSVARICNVGSMKPDLQYLALQIYELCIRYSIIIELEWIPRDLNVQADFYSKIFDFDDWSVAPHMFCFFNQNGARFPLINLRIQIITSLTILTLGFGLLVVRELMHSHSIGLKTTTGWFPQYIWFVGC